ncbi:MAG: glycerol-3-phosphate dehydrogenase/oxidase [Deltaproteobacteria bacterium]|nr:glycerol-3-phosphate dehydrogenase/oxidase [Deltaproteobacteria bacterium]
MLRDLDKLADATFDLVVVGGGIYGAAVAWDAALRGLCVALLEQADFGGATSANSLKVIHGGFRYLQSGDLPRVRTSLAERHALLSIAPHLVEPLPCLLPLTGRGVERRALLVPALLAYDLLGWNRNLGLAADRTVPPGRVLGRRRAAEMFPAFSCLEAQSAALWYDALVHDPERLTLSYLHSASQLGARPANQLQALELVHQGGKVQGVKARDLVGGGELTVRGRVVVNAAGPWSGELAGREERPPEHSRALNLVVKGRLTEAAVGLRSPLGREDDPVCGGGRFLFLVPWGDYTMLGTSYRVYQGRPAPLFPEQEEIASLWNEFRQACPGLELDRSRLSFYHLGLMPLAQPGLAPGGGGLADRPRLSRDWRGLITVEGEKFTTHRAAAERVVDLVFQSLGQNSPACRTKETPIWGGRRAANGQGTLKRLDPASCDHLARHYGSHAGEVAALAVEDPALAQPLSPASPVLGCQVAFAVEREMALTLGDVTLRRTSLGKGGNPGRPALETAAAIMGRRLGWNQERRETEVRSLEEIYRPVDPGNS